MLAIFRESTVRTVTDTNGVVWFSAYDVAQAVGYANANKAVIDNCDERVKLTDIEASISKEELAGMFSNSWSVVNMITEPMIYKMLMKGRAPLATAFVDWIAHDLLPALRKHGEYTKADMQVAGQALQAASISGTDFATEIASLKASLALAQQEAHDAQRKLQNTVFQINGSITDNRCTVTDWRNRFEPLLCVYEKRANKWGVTYTPSDAVKALGDYAYEAQRLIRTALDIRPALVFALSQKGMDKELAYKVADELERYARETQAAAHTAAHAMQEGEL